MKTIQLKIQFRSYPILVGTRLLDKLPTLLPPYLSGSNIVVITHPELSHLIESLGPLQDAGFTIRPLLIPSGETSKSWDMVAHIMTQLTEWGLDRHDTLVALGGGVIGDLVGFAASIYMRGIRYIQIPTTVLAQVDSAIGGKTGVNHPRAKNLVGTFYQPHVTIADQSVLSTLPPREIKSGLAEIVKYGVIGNAGLFKYLETHAASLATYQPNDYPELWHHVVTRSIGDKVKIVSQDEREAGLRATLNLGHTLGHALESVSGYQHYTHGEAVALGMVGVAQMAQSLGLLDPKSAQRIEGLLQKLGFDTTCQHGWPMADLLDSMRRDKKNKGGEIHWVIPTGIGSVDVMTGIPEEAVRNMLIRMGNQS